MRRFPEPQPRPPARAAAATVPALGALAALIAAYYASVWSAGAFEHTPMSRDRSELRILAEADHRYAVWAVSRNARAFLEQPLDFFDTPACFPTPGNLALGEPLLSMGVLAIVPYLFSGDPEFTYNVVAVSMSSIAGMAMFVLVRGWTGCTAAALAAAVLYLCSRGRFGEVVHPFAGDTSGALLAMHFGRRFFAGGGWGDALAAAAALVLLLGSSIYPLVGSLLVALPFVVWLARRQGLPPGGARKLLVVVAIVSGAASFVALPFLSLHQDGALVERQRQIFAEPSLLLPGGTWFQGWSRDLLALAGLIVPWSVAGRGGCDPRRALLVGGVLSLAAAMGPFLPEAVGLPREWNVWALLAAVLPPLRHVRSPMALMLGYDFVMDILASFGVAGMLGLLRRFSPLPALALLAAVGADALPYLARVRPEAFHSQPPAEVVEFFRDLKKRGNDGPIFEWPNPVFDPRTAERLTFATYHGRPTSSCFASFMSPATRRVVEIGRELPSREALAQLRAAGFTTLLLHHGVRGSGPERGLFLSQVLGRARALRMIATIPTMTAYEIVIEPGEEPEKGREGRASRAGSRCTTALLAGGVTDAAFDVVGATGRPAATAANERAPCASPWSGTAACSSRRRAET